MFYLDHCRPDTTEIAQEVIIKDEIRLQYQNIAKRLAIQD